MVTTMDKIKKVSRSIFQFPTLIGIFVLKRVIYIINRYKIMAKHTLREWYLATRPWSFSVSAMPVVVTTTFLFWYSRTSGTFEVNWLAALLALVGIVAFHAAGNLLSDYNDHRTGVDEGVVMLPLVNGSFQPREFVRFGVTMLLIGIAIGFTLISLTGLDILWVGMVGALLTVGYSWLKYHALGDLDIFLTFGLLPVVGTSIVVAGQVCLPALLLALPVGLITVGVLHVNNSRDAVTDKNAGIKTFAMLIGPKGAVVVYQLEILLPFVLVALAVALGVLPWMCILCFVVFPRGYKLARRMTSLLTVGAEGIADVDVATSQQQLFFSLLLSLSLVISALVF